MDKMRERFEKWALTECFDLTSVGGFYSDNETHAAYIAWQAAQSAAVPEHIRSIKIPTDAMEQEFQKHYRRGYEAGKGDAHAVPVVGNGMLEKFKTWKDERIGRHALIEPLEWFAGGYACAESSHAKSVPVVGEVDKMAESISGMVMEWVTAASVHNGDWQSGLARIIRKRIERFQPTTSITAAELERLQRSDAFLNEVANIIKVHGSAIIKEYSPLANHIIDAAIAGEK